MADAKWSPGKPSVAVSADGTLTAAVPVLDGGKLAATLRFTLTADRQLRVLCENQPGEVGLSYFEAWETEGSP